MKLTERPVVKHALASWERLRVTNGNLYAAAITYFSFLALFPLILLSVSVVGFVLSSHPAAVQTLFDKVAENAPGQFGSQLRDAIKAAINNRTSIGIVGLAGVLLTGLGWIGNLRSSLDAVWKRVPPKENFIKQRITNLVILGLLGFGVLVSLGLTAGWAAFSHVVLDALGLSHIPGMGTLLGFVGIAVTIVGDAVVFFLVLVRLPRVEVELRTGIKGALLAAVGFEVLKIVGTYTIAAGSHSKTAGPFVAVIAVLVWIQLVCRWMLFCTAWIAEARDAALGPVDLVKHETTPEREPAPLSPAAVGAGLVGVGAAAGAAAVVVARHRSRRPAA